MTQQIREKAVRVFNRTLTPEMVEWIEGRSNGSRLDQVVLDTYEMFMSNAGLAEEPSFWCKGEGMSNPRREKAAQFFLKAINDITRTWIDGTTEGLGVDEDVLALAALLEEVYAQGLRDGQMMQPSRARLPF